MVLARIWSKISRASTAKVEYLQEDYRNLKHQSVQTNFNLFNSPFGDCIRPVLFVVQFTGVMPVDLDPENEWRLNICSLKYFYSIFIALSVLAMSLLSFVKVLSDDLEFDKIVVFLFYLVDFLVIVQFQWLSREWENIMIVWREFERKLDQNEHLLGKRFSLKVTFQIVLLFVSILCIVAELLAVVAGVELGAKCIGVEGDTQRYFKQQFPQFFSLVEFRIWWAVILQLIQFFGTFLRMFLDVFLVLISVGLCRLIARLNLQYQTPRSSRTVTDDFWLRYKELYIQFMELVHFVDKRIGHLIVLCFASDLYLICIRILNSLKSLDTFRHVIYFWYALLFLIFRLIFVCYYASNLHQEAKRPLVMLRGIKADNWTVEAQRFQDLVTNNDVCLTGMGYFKLRRTLLLSVSELRKGIRRFIN